MSRIAKNSVLIPKETSCNFDNIPFAIVDFPLPERPVKKSVKPCFFLGGLFSFNILLIGVVGEYVTRIYDEVKTRPNYIVEDIIKKKN